MTNRIGKPQAVGQLLLDTTLNTKTVPGLSWVGDATTGIYRDASGNISVTIADTLLFTINTTGSVVVPTGYEALVTADEVMTNKKYVDDAISAAIALLPTFQSPMVQDLNDFLVVGTSGDFEDKTPAEVATILDGFWVKTGGDTMTGQLTMAAGIDILVQGGGELVGLPITPSGPTAATSKAYVDSVIAGRDNKEHCKVATDTYLDNVGNGTWVPGGGPGVGKTLTAGAVGVTTIDGYGLGLGDRVLVKDEDGSSTNLTNVDNGIYEVTTEGDGVTATVLTRATDSDGTPTNEVSSGNFTFIQQGTTNGGSGWMISGDVPGDIDVDVDPIVWIQVSDTSQIIDGAGLLFTGLVLDVRFGAGITQLPADYVGIDVASGQAVQLTGATDTDQLTLVLDGSTMTQSGTGLKIAAGGVTEVELNTSVAGPGLGGGGGAVLEVNVDNPSGVVITGDAVGLANVPNSSLANDDITFAVFAPATSAAIALGGTFTIDANNGLSGAIVGTTLTLDADVVTVFGRTGTVVGQAGDYNAAQITYDNAASGLTATDVQAAIDELVTGGGISFTGLSDTPSAYTGTAGYWLRVNSTPDGVEFYDATAVGSAALIGADDTGLTNIGAFATIQAALGAIDTALGSVSSNRIEDADADTYMETDFGTSDDDTLRMRVGVGAGNHTTGVDVFTFSAGAGLSVLTPSASAASGVQGGNISFLSGQGDGAAPSGNISLTTGDQTALGGDSGDIILETGPAGTTDAGDIVLRPGSGAVNDGVVIIDGVGGTTTPSALRLVSNNDIDIIAPAAVTAPYTLTLPVDDGNPGEVLSTNGSGTLSWIVAGGGGSSTFIGLSDTPTNYNGTPQVTDVDFLLCPPGAGWTAGGGPGDYWLLEAASGPTLYHVYYNVTDAGGSTPPPAPGLPIMVSILAADTPDLIAAKTALAINAQAIPGNFLPIPPPAPLATLITITDGINGPATPAVDFNTPGPVTFPSTTLGTAGHALELLQVNAGETALEYVTPSAMAANISFLDIGDTPGTYAGANSFFVKVNAAGNALEFSSLASSGITAIQDVDGDTAIQVEETADEDTVRIDLGDNVTGYVTQKADALVFNTAGLQVDLSNTATGTDQAGAPITLIAGNGAATNGGGGAITLTTGTGAGSGVDGNVIVTRGQIEAPSSSNPAGLAGFAPQYSFNGDLDSGFYRAGTSIRLARNDRDFVVVNGTPQNNVTIQASDHPAGGGTNESGGTMLITGGKGSGTGDGGNITVRAGTSGDDSAIPGNILIEAGDISGSTSVTASAQDNGKIDIVGGTINSTNASSIGGAINITGGPNTAAGPAGHVNITGGDATTDEGGDIILTGGRGSSAANDGAVILAPTATDDRVTELRFLETVAGGVEYVGFKAPDNIDTAGTGDGVTTIWTLPAGDGADGESMITNGTGTLSWQKHQPMTDLKTTTPDATPKELSGDGAGIGFYTIATDTAHVLDINIIAREDTTGTGRAAWNIKVVIENDGGTTALVGTAVTTVITNAPGWSVAVTADDTNDRLAITVTGAAATDIDWKATITAAVAP